MAVVGQMEQGGLINDAGVFDRQDVVGVLQDDDRLTEDPLHRRRCLLDLSDGLPELCKIEVRVDRKQRHVVDDEVVEFDVGDHAVFRDECLDAF